MLRLTQGLDDELRFLDRTNRRAARGMVRPDRETGPNNVLTHRAPSPPQRQSLWMGVDRMSALLRDILQACILAGLILAPVALWIFGIL